MFSILKLYIYIFNSVLRYPLIRKHRRIASYDEYEFRELFGMDRRFARDVMLCWGIFEVPIILTNGSTFHGEEAFLFHSARMHNFGKLTMFEREFGIEYSQLSRLFAHISRQMAVQHFDLLFNNLHFFSPRFQEYNAKINQKCIHLHGHVLPHTYRRVCGFQDGTRIHVRLYMYNFLESYLIFYNI